MREILNEYKKWMGNLYVIIGLIMYIGLGYFVDGMYGLIGNIKGSFVILIVFPIIKFIIDMLWRI